MDLHDRPRRAALALAGAGIALFMTGVTLDTTRWAFNEGLAGGLFEAIPALLIPAYVLVQAIRRRPISTTLTVQPRTIDRWLAILLIVLCLVTMLFTIILATSISPAVQPGPTALSQVGRYLTILAVTLGIAGAMVLQRWWALRPPSNAA